MMKSFNLRALAIAGTLSLAAALYAFVPPPPGAKAFEAQSTWGGTGGGTANAQTVAIHNVLSLNDVLGVPLRYVPAADNTGPATIAINGLTATAVRRPSNIGLVALSGGELQAGVTMTVMYNGATIEIQGPVDMTPIGKSVEFRQSVTPRGTLIEDGSCVSRTTYAPLFSAIGTNYGACDGTTTFGLPFSNGRSFVALDNQGTATANVVTSAGSGCNATAVGVCGSQAAALTASLLPTITSANTASIALAVISTQPIGVSGAGATGIPANAANSTGTIGSNGTIAIGNAAVTSNNTGGASSVSHPVLNPISLGRRAIKY